MQGIFCKISSNDEGCKANCFRNRKAREPRPDTVGLGIFDKGIYNIKIDILILMFYFSGTFCERTKCRHPV